MVEQDYIEVLVNRINECLSLSLADGKRDATANLISRYASELKYKINRPNISNEEITKCFKNYVNKVLSTIESLNLAEAQYKAIRKLIQAEIYGCLETIINSRTREIEDKRKK